MSEENKDFKKELNDFHKKYINEKMTEEIHIAWRRINNCLEHYNSNNYRFSKDDLYDLKYSLPHLKKCVDLIEYLIDICWDDPIFSKTKELLEKKGEIDGVMYY